MQRTLIIEALAATAPQPSITICGWIRTRRDAKEFSFVELNDGSCLGNMQCIVDAGTTAHQQLADAATGAAISVTGELVASPGKGQQWEIRAHSVTVFGLADAETFPLQKKRHSDEFLRTIAHLRSRTNKYGAAFRIRSEAGQAVHQFFQGRRFSWVHTPVLTGADCEGAGEMFRVTSLEPGNNSCCAAAQATRKRDAVLHADAGTMILLLSMRPAQQGANGSPDNVASIPRYIAGTFPCDGNLKALFLQQGQLEFIIDRAGYAQGIKPRAAVGTGSGHADPDCFFEHFKPPPVCFPHGSRCVFP